VAFLASPIALGSWWALVPIVPLIGLIAMADPGRSSAAGAARGSRLRNRGAILPDTGVCDLSLEIVEAKETTEFKTKERS
jgi:hypothetical protein